jgi:hypothetical protein
MTIVIVLIEIDHFKDGRDKAHAIESMSFKSVKDIYKELKLDENKDDKYVQIYTLIEFVYLCNEQSINLQNHWISYVNIID